MESLLPTISHLGVWSYWIILLIGILESSAFVGLVVPGTIVMLLAGFVAARGVLDIGDVIWFAAIGAIIGDSLSYGLGRHFHDRPSRISSSAAFRHGEQFFRAHGGKSVFLGRFVGLLRPIIPFVAGYFGMRRAPYFLWNIISGFGWALLLSLLGYTAGHAWDTIAVWSTRIGLLILTLTFILIVIAVIYRFLLRNGKRYWVFLQSILRSTWNAIAANTDVQRFVRRHPMLASFFQRRLNPQRLSGLPLSLLVVAFLYLLSLLVGVVGDVLIADSIVAADQGFMQLLMVFRYEPLVRVFLAVTTLGQWQIIGSVVAVSSLLLWLRGRRTMIIPLWITVAGSAVMATIGKWVIHRPRPPASVYIEHSFAFPSGHATLAVAMYGFLAYLLVRQVVSWRNKIRITIVGVLLILAVGFSRLYLGVHYLSDVWSGYLIGAIWLLVGITIAEWLRMRESSAVRVPTRPHQRIAAVALLSVECVIVAVFAIRYHPPLANTPSIEAVQRVPTAEIVEVFRAIPQYTKTLLGAPQEPISFLIIAHDDETFGRAFMRSGWTSADPVNARSLLHIATAAANGQPYRNAPITPSFWRGTVHQFSFEKPTPSMSVRERHHARFWRTNLQTPDGAYVYAGTASLDVGMKWLITHRIAPDIDTEREVLSSDLTASGVVRSMTKHSFVAPTLGKNFSGDPFFTDGNGYLIELQE